MEDDLTNNEKELDGFFAQQAVKEFGGVSDEGR
jgi:hypothetical protein